MSYKFVRDKTSVDPITGELVTPDELNRRGHSKSTRDSAYFLKKSAEWDARPPPDYAISANDIQIRRDIEPYKAVAVDIATGNRPIIGGRAQHREFLKRNGFTEVGNAVIPPRRAELPTAERVADIRRAMRDI